MKNNIKISFDFDSTLDNIVVQEYAKSLLSKGFEIWIVTSRMDNESARNYMWNKDLFEVSDNIGIDRNNINFCNMEDKYHFFNRNEGFLWHLDDDMVELDFINSETKTIGIHVEQPGWIEKCNDLIKKG